MTPTRPEAVNATLQALGQGFVPYANRPYGRTGILWEGRFKASLVQEEDYLLSCHRYVELNPLRAGTVERPEDIPGRAHAPTLRRP